MSNQRDAEKRDAGEDAEDGQQQQEGGRTERGSKRAQTRYATKELRREATAATKVVEPQAALSPSSSSSVSPEVEEDDVEDVAFGFGSSWVVCTIYLMRARERQGGKNARVLPFFRQDKDLKNPRNPRRSRRLSLTGEVKAVEPQDDAADDELREAKEAEERGGGHVRGVPDAVRHVD
jgi:hypothetical protein